MIKLRCQVPMWLLGALFIALLTGPRLLTAQANVQTTTPASSEAEATTPETQGDKGASSSPEQQKPHNDRLFFMMPNFLTVENAGDIKPLTSGQKFKLVARSTFDPVEYPWVGIIALVNQAGNSDPSLGQGFGGYAKRYATAFADTTISNFMTNAVYPSLLQQDPRYFQMGKGKFLRRAGCALSRIFVTRSDSGHKQFNYSEIVGAATAAGISNLYHVAPRTLGKSIDICWTQITWDAVSFELKEFWPDLRRKIRK